MSFSTKQTRALKRELDERKVRTRQINGRELSYIEGWHAIAEANRIFGFDSWSRETIETRCIYNREVRGTFTVVYSAKVRISVFSDGQIITREGHGTGESQGTSPGETHDIALKAAETDGTKRALATFGKPFGLSLYLAGRKDTLGGHDRRALPSPRYRSSSAIDADLLPPRTEADKAPAAKVVNGSEARETPICGPALLEALQTPQSVSPLGYPRRLRDRRHLKFVSNQLCLKCARWPSDAHHLTYAQPRAMGMKVSDEFVVPLCRLHHREVHHARNELAWWNDIKIDPLEVAHRLWQESHAGNKDSKLITSPDCPQTATNTGEPPAKLIADEPHNS
jgi:Rad52/22 family double-strand break repair protein